MENNMLYSGKAILPRTPKSTAIALCFVVVFYAVVCVIAQFLPASWLFELGAIVVSAVMVNKILKDGTFTLTYILYEDRLVFRRRYGFLENDTHEFKLSECTITKSSIISNGKSFDFYPDKRLKELLNL